MDQVKIYIVSASLLLAIGAAFCVPRKTQPVGMGVIAGGVVYIFAAILCLIFGQ